jgi:hypothetical protein
LSFIYKYRIFYSNFQEKPNIAIERGGRERGREKNFFRGLEAAI